MQAQGPGGMRLSTQKVKVDGEEHPIALKPANLTPQDELLDCLHAAGLNETQCADLMALSSKMPTPLLELAASEDSDMDLPPLLKAASSMMSIDGETGEPKKKGVFGRLRQASSSAVGALSRSTSKLAVIGGGKKAEAEVPTLIEEPEEEETEEDKGRRERLERLQRREAAQAQVISMQQAAAEQLAAAEEAEAAASAAASAAKGGRRMSRLSLGFRRKASNT